ncbi:MAG: filamentous hemagglutinin N-terminal domain-containing protein [Alphaproteobacteria bacterium]|nr:filamentous hemagglutinin N-terminal domain-containing protein [Alphaproteobacteria bacterium]
MSNNRIRLFATTAMTAATLTLLPMPAAKAMPTGGVVVGGSATISPIANNTTTINQTTPRAAIDWTSFSVAQGETVNFTASADLGHNFATLNRVTGNAASSIQGTVTSAGTLYLVNPNGIVFETGSQVTAQNFFATTSNIDPANFMSGNKFTTERATANARIDLRGNITVADRGIVGIFSPQVVISGTITANLGKVSLGGAQVTTIDFTGDGLMSFEVGTTTGRADDNNVNEAIKAENHGSIAVNGGSVSLTAKGATDLLNALIISDGTISAESLTAKGGDVTVKAVNGSVAEMGSINASGSQGGGNVMVWASQNAFFNGDIKADALANSQAAFDGGFVEVSGRINLAFGGTVSTLSQSGGTLGTLLLDPTDIVVSTKYAGALTWSNYWQAQIISSTVPSYTISPTTIVNALKTNNVVLEATNSLTVNAEIDWFTGVSTTNNRNLTLIAGDGGVTINQDIWSSNYGGLYIKTTGVGNVVINALIYGNFIDINSAGSINVNDGGPYTYNGISYPHKPVFLYFNNYATLTAVNNITVLDCCGVVGYPSYFAPSKTYEANFTAISKNGNVTLNRFDAYDFTARSDVAYPKNLGTVTIEAEHGSVKIGSLTTQKLSGVSRDGWSANFAQTYDNSGKYAYSPVTLGDITNTGTGGIKITSVNEVSFSGNLSGGNGSVTITTYNKNVTLADNVNVTGKDFHLNLGSGGFVAETYTLTAAGVDMFYTGGAITTTDSHKAIDLGTGRFYNELQVNLAAGSSYSLATNFWFTGIDPSTYSQKVTAANSTLFYALNVTGGGSVTINNVSSSASVMSGTVRAADLNLITANGITISGTNSFAGDVKLVSYGSVSVPQNGPAGIYVGSAASLTTKGSLTLQQQSNVTGTGTTTGIRIAGTLKTIEGDLTLTQNGSISASGTSASASGILIDHATLSASVGKDLTLTQNGEISASGQGGGAYGININGSSSGSATLTAAHDINFTQNGAISATGSLASALGIVVDGSSSGSAALTAAHDINFIQNGAISATGQGGGGYGININGSSRGSAALTAGNNVTLNVLARNETQGSFNNSIGIFLNDSKITANSDIIINQNGDLTSNMGGSFGILIYNTSSRTFPNYSLYAKRDIWFAENGNLSASGKFNYAIGVTIDGARLVAGRNVYGVQSGNVTENYTGESAGFHITDSEINAGNASNSDAATSSTSANAPGSITFIQSGNVNQSAPDANASYATSENKAPDNATATNAPYATTTNITQLPVVNLPVPSTTTGVAYGVYIGSSQFYAQSDITINQIGTVNGLAASVAGVDKYKPTGVNGILLTSVGTQTHQRLLLSAGSVDGMINLLSSGNDVALLSTGLLASNPNPRIATKVQSSGSFVAKGNSLHVDLGGGVFNAGNQMLDAASVSTLIIALPKEDTKSSSKLIKGGKSFFYIDQATDQITPVVVAINMGQNGKVTRVTTFEQNQTINGTFDTSSTNLDNYMPTGVYAGTYLPGSANFDATAIHYIAGNVGVKAKGTVTISGVPSAPADGPSTLSWIEGDTIKVTGTATFGNDTTIVASGNLANMDAVSSPNIYAGIYVASGAALSTGTGKNLTLIQNGLFTAAANANAYGVYVANGGTIGNAGAAGTVSIRQNGAISATGTGRASGVYLAGTIAQGGNITIDQIGKISSTGSVNGITLLSGATINAGANKLSLNSGNKDIALNGTITAAALAANAGSNLAISTVLDLSGDFTANAGDDVTVTNAVTANKLSASAGGHVTFGNIVTANSFAASAGGHVTATNSGNQIKALGNLTGDTVKIATFNTASADEVGKTVNLTGDIKANNLYLYSYIGANKSNEYYGTTYNLVGTMKMSNQSGNLAPNSRFISGNDVQGDGSFSVLPVKEGVKRNSTLNADGLYNTLNATVTR